MIFRIMVLLALFATCRSTMGAESTIEDVALHDGRRIKVERSVYRPTEFKILDPFFGLPTMPRTQTGGPKFSLRFRHPNTQETITWQGEQHYSPVLLDIVSGVPYLVVNGTISKETEAIYGCPELPYFYLKYESGFFGKWVPVPVENAPDVLRISNLSQGSRSDGGYFQKVIPRTYEDWNYQYKNEHRNERKVWDCRPPLKPLPDIPLPQPIDIELDIVESRDYDQRYPDDLPNKPKSEVAITRRQCESLFRIADTKNVPGDILLGEQFVNDPTGVKRLPYTGPKPSPSGYMLGKRADRYCNSEFVWFVAGHEERNKTVITKYTASGDYVYSIRFQNPETAPNKMYRSMVVDSLTVEDGYFSFYWWQDLPTVQGPPMIYSHRLTKHRFREPEMPNPAVQGGLRDEAAQRR